MKSLKIISLLLFFFALYLTSAYSTIAQQSTPQLLINGNTLTKFYDEESDHDNRSDYINDFGAWAIQPVGNVLYLALGGQPNTNDGAQIIKFENNSLTNLPVINKGDNWLINEQGINDLHWSASLSKLIVPGTDPADNNGWEWGTMYTYSPSDTGLKKYREGSGLTGVVHIWGIDEHKGALYIAAHSSSGTKVKIPTGIGEVLKSTDQGQTWQRVTQDPNTATSPNDFFGTQVVDIKSFNNALYVYKILNSDVSLNVSRDDGKTWKKIDSMIPYSKPRMIVYKEQIIFIGRFGRFGNTISAINKNDQEEIFEPLPKRIADTDNNMTTDGNYVYYLGNDSKVYYSQDLKKWSVLAEFNGSNLTSIAYWPEKKSVIISTRGAQPSIYTVQTPVAPSQEIISKQCSVSIDKTTLTDKDTFTVSVTGKSSKSSDEPLKLWIKKVDNNKILPLPVGSKLIENLDAGTNYYLFADPVCQTKNNQECSDQITITALPTGKYQVFCDLAEAPNSCSGNPNCPYKDGSSPCEGFVACSTTDSVTFDVTTSIVPPSIQDPDYNNNKIVDIYDYNSLITNYGKTDCSFNLVGTCTLDLNDLNKFISSYGNKY